MNNKLCAAGTAALLVYGADALGQDTKVATRELVDLSLEELSNIVVSSVSGRPELLSGALASVYVISGEDIRRSGATSIPDALRLAPNLQIARTGASGYAITARGFNDPLANKLLVLIDGRAVYTPTFSGVFWEAQDVMIEDIARIEVISGPGGVLWGANAVNGVINILTKSSAETQGNLVTAGGGTNEAGVAARHGGTLGNGSYRLYAKAVRRDDLSLPTGTELQDGSDRRQAGFRSDWQSGLNGYTLQGDVYFQEGTQQPEAQELRGANLLARWSKDLGGGEALRVQAYYDRTSREQQTLDTADLELQHMLRARGAHRLLWGGGLRYSRDRIDNSALLAFLPPDKDLPGWNVYAQDEITLRDDLEASIGAKIDHNTYTGAEFLPSARLGWRVTPEHLAWTAVSRAVRTPSRFDRELFLPGIPPFLLAGGPNFESEVAYVYELGYRGTPFTRLQWSATAFYHDLDKVRSISPGAGGANVANDREGHTKGFETWAAYRITDGWRLHGGFTRLETNLRVKEGAIDLQPAINIASDPPYWWQLRSSHDFGKSIELDLMMRHYAEIENRSVPSYTALDLRLGWMPLRELELSLLLQNLLDPGHIEWAPGTAEFERAAYLKASLRF
jgi:iron complex outermembrane receptor protein